MRKTFKSLLTALLFAFVIAALTGLGTVKAAAYAETSGDLDGDGIDEVIVYEIDETDEYNKFLAALTINGKDVLASVQLEENFEAEWFNVEVFDSCTKDGVKELLIQKSVENWTESYLFRYKGGKVSLYCKVDAGGLISQKKKNFVVTNDYVFVNGIGNIYVNLTYKVKSGRAVFATAPLAPNKNNEKVTFKTNRKVTLYSDEYVAEKIGTLKKGAKFKLVKMVRDGEGKFTRICVKSNGVTGWIDTTAFDSSKFIIKNPPVWE